MSIVQTFPPGIRATTESLPKDLDATLARPGRLNLYRHHFPSSRVDIPRPMEVMTDAVQTGKTRAVSVSNDSAEPMRVALTVPAGRGIPLTSNQLEYALPHP